VRLQSANKVVATGRQSRNRSKDWSSTVGLGHAGSRESDVRRDMIFYVPPEYAEAVGWASIGWAQLETAVDIILALGSEAIGASPGRPGSFESRVEGLRALAQSEALTKSWRSQLSSLADVMVGLRADLHDSAHGTLYGRALDNAALDTRMLHGATGLSAVMSRMTTVKVERLAEEMTAQTRRAIAFAMLMAERAGIVARDCDPRSGSG
jgi:hypothetical protein